MQQEPEPQGWGILLSTAVWVCSQCQKDQSTVTSLNRVQFEVYLIFETENCLGFGLGWVRVFFDIGKLESRLVAVSGFSISE